jgi:transposase
MLKLPATARIVVATRPVHWNAGVDRLVQVARDELGENPFSGTLFCFFSRRRTEVKLLTWDRNGFWFLCKRLERGRFETISLPQPSVEIDRVTLALLLEGIDTRSLRLLKHFVREVRIEARDHAVQSGSLA